MKQDARAAAAFFLAPPIAVAVEILRELCIVVFQNGLSESLVLAGQFWAVLKIATIFAWSFAILFGVPLYILLRWLRIFSPWVTIGFAAAIGAWFNIFPEFLPKNETTNFWITGCQIIANGTRTLCGYWELASDVLSTATLGAVAGLIFWPIYAGGWKRPVI
ncbi:hypothetical protein [Mesorhizobium sp. M1322]|uniref:hypothetical protein n=1 Tax=Mesorhizobium sp. M1322 TaxID=2957081 RepID=UPI00333C462E